MKTALGRTAARSKHPVAARQAIAAGAELAAKVPGTERTGTSSVCYQAGSPRVAMDVLIVWSTLIRQYLGN